MLGIQGDGHGVVLDCGGMVSFQTVRNAAVEVTPLRELVQILRENPSGQRAGKGFSMKKRHSAEQAKSPSLRNPLTGARPRPAADL